MDKIEGHLEIGSLDGEVIVNIPPLKKKREQHKMNCAYRGNTEELCNCGIEYEHINFSPNQARGLAAILLKQADEAEGAVMNFGTVHSLLRSLLDFDLGLPIFIMDRLADADPRPRLTDNLKAVLL